MTAKVPAKDNYKNNLKYKSISDLASMKTSMINDKYTYENSLTDMNVSNVWTHYGHILEPLKSCPKYDQTFGYFKFSKNHLMVPKECPKFGHFWTYFGHIMHIWTCFLISLSGVQNLSNIWTSFWTYLTGLDVFWAHFGHI